MLTCRGRQKGGILSRKYQINGSHLESVPYVPLIIQTEERQRLSIGACFIVRQSEKQLYCFLKWIFIIILVSVMSLSVLGALI